MAYKSSADSKGGLSKDLHEKHRQRMKQSFRDAGLQGFQPHNIVEMMLFYSLPRCNTNETAHLLLNEFGSIAGVLDAPFEALTNIYGVGTESATFIKFLPELFRAYEESKFAEKPYIETSDAAKKYLASYFKTATAEKLVILYLDARCRIIKDAEISQGNENMVYTDLSSIVKSALLLNAKGVIIAHNHISGFATPSAEDKEMTERLAKMLMPVGIHLCDHLLFAGKDVLCFSKTKHIKSNLLVF
ncbi:MAG: hypothetical protein J6A97_04370 [Clostridia bacterium]|nr:hypothetical protein [Clostridia bacterium]